jgi:hypothetical protein
MRGGKIDVASRNSRSINVLASLTQRFRRKSLRLALRRAIEDGFWLVKVYVDTCCLLRANSGHPPMAWRTGQIDPSLPFPMSRYGRNFSKSGRRRYGQTRKAASIRDQATD